MTQDDAVLSWLHIGDLHLTEAGEANHRDLARVVALAERLPPGSVDFTLLPGDTAEDGAAPQFRLARDAVAPLRLPLHVLTGDHDFKQRSLDVFYDVLGVPRLPYAITAKDHRCLFLDVVSAGAGGPAFRLDDTHLDWAARELGAAQSAGRRAAVCMHTFPADLRQGAERLRALLARKSVACVAMGHTHYNELANDGGTVFMATRSTGQVEEGPPGFAIAAVDCGGVSWRFKPLDAAWPFVLVTRPVDRRLLTGSDQAVAGRFAVRAKVVGDAPIEVVEMRLDDGAWTAMARASNDPTLWRASGDAPCASLAVRARDARGRVDQERVEPAGPGHVPPARAADGSDRDRVGAWPEQGVLGTQLGPNRHGRKW